MRIGTKLSLVALLCGIGPLACALEMSEEETGQTVDAIVSSGVDATLKLSSDWGAGYCADVVLKNTSSQPVTNWQLTLQMNGSSLANIWSATSTGNGSLTISPVDYNRSIAAGGSVNFGFCANGTGRPTITALVVTGGGAGSGGTSSGGTTGSGGISTGGTASGGSSTGGAASGGASTGGTASGGTSSGGTASGGSSTGGSSSGGGGGASACTAAPTGHFQMEDLDRGLIAVRSGSGNYVGWRMLGQEYDPTTPSRVAYRLYRNGSLVTTVTGSTNYYDSGAASSATYAVALVLDGVECQRSGTAPVRANNYISIPLTPPPAGTTPSGEAYSYNSGTVTRSAGAVNDGSPGDVDGDGEYELIVIWEPSNAKDNSAAGYTGPVYMDAYKLNGTRLWRLNLGPNIRAGAHYTQFVVYDFDGDGKAEVAVKTAPGTRDGTGAFLSRGPAASDNDSADYRNSSGYVLSGPEYLTVFEGATGKELATVNFEAPRGTVSSWGDNYGNRVDRFLASAGFVSDTGSAGKGSGRPAILMGRGYYTRATVSAWTYRNGTLSKIWQADSNTSGSGALAGQGAHSMKVADVDADDAQEIVYGAAMIQSNGTFGCATGYGHGDALHVTDLIPSRAGLEVFMPHEDTSKPTWDVRDARTCQVLHVSPTTGVDNGRGVADDILASNPGAEFWSAAESNLRSATTGASVGAKPSMINFTVYWDGDDLRELLDGTNINKGNGTRLFTGSGIMSNNHTKATPTLTADLFGDWREEVVWRTPTSNELRVYTTTAVTSRRLFTLMHDAQYRMQVTSEMTAYNQPPQPGFFLGDGMTLPKKPNIHVK